MFEGRKKLKPGEKSLWQKMGREEDQEVEEVEQPVEEQEEKPEKFKMIKGLVRGGGLSSVFKKRS